MRIIMPTFERIEWMPPTITLLKKLSALGYEVVCITLYPSDYLERANINNVSQINLYHKEICIQKLISYHRGISGVLFRIDNVIKRIVGLRLSRCLKRIMRDDDILWIVNEMTVKFGGTSFLKKYPYLFTIYELHERTFSNRHIEKAAKLATEVIVPEYCRAHIMKSRYSLPKLPHILPNKSDLEQVDPATVTEEVTQAINRINTVKAEGKKIVLYMGGVDLERPLHPFLEAIKDNKEYVLAIIGRPTNYLNTLLSQYDNILYLGGFPPPLHLQVAKQADIGLLVYVDHFKGSELNALFCAPNKIYEYTGLGLPVLANDIPGLRFEVMPTGIGQIVEYNNPDSVIKGLKAIEDDYPRFSKAAIGYFNETDISTSIQQILSDYIHNRNK